MIRITSKKDGFYRCGVSHPAKPTDYPDDRFAEAELKALKNEPMLEVQKLKGDPENPSSAEVAVNDAEVEQQLKAALQELEGLKALQSDLTERVKALDEREAEIVKREEVLTEKAKPSSDGKQDKPEKDSKTKK